MNLSKPSTFVSGGLRLAACLLAMRLSAPVGAADTADWQHQLQVHGFAAQGFVHTSDNRFYGDSEHGSFDFTELGLNLSYKPMSSLLLSGQLLSRTAGEMYDGSPTVDFALVDWTVASDADGSWGVMAGRIKNPLGLYNDTRDVAFTRPGIFLPQQIYFDRVRNLLHSSDGVHVYARHYSDIGVWDIDLGIGLGTVDENVEVAFLNRDFAGELVNEELGYVGRIGFETADGVWRLALSGARVGLDFEARASDPIGSGEVDTLFWIASLQYNQERWSLTTEYMQEPVEFDGFGPLVDGRDATGESYYLQGTYLLRNDLELLLRYGEGYADRDDRDGTDNAAMSGGLIPAHRLFQRDWTVGLRWDVTPNFMLRAEYQWANGTLSLSQRENRNLNDTRENWEMFSVLGAYRF
jgi:opacity protein-like surface antigen